MDNIDCFQYGSLFMKPIQLSLLSLALLLAIPPLWAQGYRCEENGQVTISTLPCPASARSQEFQTDPAQDAKIKAANDAAAESAAQEMARLKAKADSMERERLSREAAQTPVITTPQPTQEADAAARKPGQKLRMDRIREANKPVPPSPPIAPAPPKPSGK
jgi:hypothetical protein